MASILSTLENLKGTDAGGKDRTRFEEFVRPILFEVGDDTGSDFVLLSLIADTKLRVRIGVAINPEYEQLAIPDELDLPIAPLARACASWGRKFFPNGYSARDTESFEDVCQFNCRIREKAWYSLTFREDDDEILALVCLIRCADASGKADSFTEDEVLTAWFKSQRFISENIYDRRAPDTFHHAKFVLASRQVGAVLSSSGTADFWRGIAECLVNTGGMGWESAWILELEERELLLTLGLGRDGNEGRVAISSDGTPGSNPFSSSETAVKMSAAALESLFPKQSFAEFGHSAESIREFLSPLEPASDQKLAFAWSVWNCLLQWIKREQISCSVQIERVFFLPLEIDRERFLVFLTSTQQEKTPSAALSTLFLEWAAIRMADWKVNCIEE